MSSKKGRRSSKKKKGSKSDIYAVSPPPPTGKKSRKESLSRKKERRKSGKSGKSGKSPVRRHRSPSSKSDREVSLSPVSETKKQSNVSKTQRRSKRTSRKGSHRSPSKHLADEKTIQKPKKSEKAVINEGKLVSNPKSLPPEDVMESDAVKRPFGLQSPKPPPITKVRSSINVQSPKPPPITKVRSSINVQSPIPQSSDEIRSSINIQSPVVKSSVSTRPFGVQSPKQNTSSINISKGVALHIHEDDLIGIPIRCGNRLRACESSESVRIFKNPQGKSRRTQSLGNLPHPEKQKRSSKKKKSKSITTQYCESNDIIFEEKNTKSTGKSFTSDKQRSPKISKQSELKNAKANLPHTLVTSPAQSSMIMKIDVLSHMKLGHTFVKYGSKGFPHSRMVQLTENNMAIRYFTDKKHAKNSNIQLQSITGMSLGQRTSNFSRNPDPKHAKHSFSLIYAKGKKSLDLISKDMNEFELWTNGLGKLLSLLQQGKKISDLKVLICQIRIHNCGNISIIEYNSGKSANNFLGPPEKKKEKVDISKKNKLSKKFSALEKNVDGTANKLRSPKYQSSDYYSTMDMLMQQVEKNIIIISDLIADEQYVLAEDEVWKTEVDFESLNSMMKSLN